jgi:hypothetical protein
MFFGTKRKSAEITLDSRTVGILSGARLARKSVSLVWANSVWIWEIRDVHLPDVGIVPTREGLFAPSAFRAPFRDARRIVPAWFPRPR